MNRSRESLFQSQNGDCGYASYKVWEFFKWSCLVIQKKQFNLIMNYIIVIIHWVYTLAMLGYLLSPSAMKVNTMANKLLGFVFLSCLLVTMFTSGEFYWISYFQKMHFKNFKMNFIRWILEETEWCCWAMERFYGCWTMVHWGLVSTQT